MKAVAATIHNFNSGPSVLPRQVFEEASRAILDFNNTGLSILEIGHRTPLFEAVMAEARALVRELMNLDDEQEVLFLHGGATTQFMQVPMNLLNENDVASYTETGTWAIKAIKEAKLFLVMWKWRALPGTRSLPASRKNYPYHLPPVTCISPPMKRLPVPNGIICLLSI